MGFRVIIIGGGPVGLTAAHMLHAAGIDFVVLEKHADFTTTFGSCQGLWPSTLRVLDQLGLLHDESSPPSSRPGNGPSTTQANSGQSAQNGTTAPSSQAEPSHTTQKENETTSIHTVEKIPNNISSHLHHLEYYTLLGGKSGTSYVSQPMFPWLERLTGGWSWHPIWRPDLLRILYTRLPDAAKARLKANVQVSDIELVDGPEGEGTLRGKGNNNGVRVRCSDGSIYTGSLVIGVDGVHSFTRNKMRELALRRAAEVLASSSPSASANPKPLFPAQPYKTSYRMLACQFHSSSVSSATKPGSYEAQGQNCCSTTIYDSVSPNPHNPAPSWFLFWEELPIATSADSSAAIPAQTHDRIRHTAAHETALVQKHGSWHLMPELTLKEAYDRRVAGRMFSAEEGLLPTWHFERVVLVGDAAHKASPKAGWGYNLGAMDMVVLVNRLRRLLGKEGTGPRVGNRRDEDEDEDEDEDGSENENECEPDTAAISTMLETYQKARMADTKDILQMDRLMVRSYAWSNWWFKLAGDFIMGRLGLSYYGLKFCIMPVVTRSPVLEWLLEPHATQGTWPYKNYPKVGKPVSG